jgi:hypothetical protein
MQDFVPATYLARSLIFKKLTIESSQENIAADPCGDELLKL